jgi:anti-sigma28 factor (negative regulator of flagellin synthesis)
MQPDQPRHPKPEDGESIEKPMQAPERQQHVEEVREQVRNGSYEVDSKELAKALIKRHIAS